MVLAAIVLLRDEADIFPALAQHLAALFDIALFLDHGSHDGTTALIEAACRSHPRWMRWHVAVPGQHQGLFTTFAMQHLFAHTGARAIFLIDADEFIDVPDRAALEAALAPAMQAGCDPRCMPALAWVNAIPADLSGQTIRFGDALLTAPTPSAFEKVIVTRTLFDATGGRLAIFPGNHAANPGDGLPLTTRRIGTLLHLPLRSLAQMTRKVVAGALAQAARADLAANESLHWSEALARIAGGTLNAPDLLGWAARYGEPGGFAQPSSEAALIDAGFRIRALDVAHAGDPPAADLPAAASPWAIMANALAAWRYADAADLTLSLRGATLVAETRPAVPPGAAENRAAARAENLADTRAENLPAAQSNDHPAAWADDLAAARAALDTLRQSTSWRITAPLRTAAEVFAFRKKSRKPAGP